MNTNIYQQPQPRAQGGDVADLVEILMAVVQLLMDQGWEASKISDDLRQTASVVDLLHKTHGVPQ